MRCRRERSTFFVLFLCWALLQHCFDQNTPSARLSKLNATPAVEVSGGQIPPSTNKKRSTSTSSAISAHHFPPSGSPQTTKQRASPLWCPSSKISQRTPEQRDTATPCSPHQAQCHTVQQRHQTQHTKSTWYHSVIFALARQVGPT